MAALTRQAYVKPSIDSLSAKIFTESNSLVNLYRNEEQFATNTFDDTQKSFIPSLLFWADKDLHYTNREADGGGSYVSMFLEFDPKVPLRGGNFKRTELGYMLPEMLTRENDAKPGDDLVTKKQHYLNPYQDIAAPIDDIHLRSVIDWHVLDFAEHFNDFSDYNRITQGIFKSMDRGLRLVDQLLVDTYIVSLFGGFLHSYPIGSPLFRFFTKNNEGFVPDEGFSKNAAQFFKQDGHLAKKVQELSKWVQNFYKARWPYLTNIVNGEVIGSNADKTIPKRNELLADVSTNEKCLETVRKWYLVAGSDNKYTKTGFEIRRLSLYSFLSALSGTIEDMTVLDCRNWCGHDFFAENKDKKGLPLRCNYTDLVVFMNNEDLREAENGLVGNTATGPFIETFNGTIGMLKSLGVTFFGLNYIAPGNAAVIDKAAFVIKEFYQTDNREYFAYHLVESRIKHVFKKPVLYGKMAGRIIQPGAGQQYAVPLYWGSKHLPLLAEYSDS